MYRLQAGLLTIMFLAGIFAPLLKGLLEPDASISAREKRSLAALPERPGSLADVQRYPRRFDDYYADHFGFRETLVSWYKQLKYALGDAPSADVILGRNGWVFLGGIAKGYTKYADPVGDARHVNRYTPETLAAMANYLVAVKNWLAVRGVRYLFVVAPNKHSIYPENLPPWLVPEYPDSALDQLLAYVREHTDVPVLDLRPVLLRAKEHGEVYYYHDSHWNWLGANHAQQAIREEIEKLIPGSLDATLFPMKKGQEREGDLHAFLGMLPRMRPALVPDFKGDCQPRLEPPGAAPRDVHSQYCDRGRLQVLVYRDSFFSHLEPYLSRVFARLTSIWTKVDKTSLQAQLDKNKPDLVIEEWVERNLPMAPDASPFLETRLDLSNAQSIYTMARGDLRFNARIRVLSFTATKLVLESIGNDPYMQLPRLSLAPDGAYVMHIRLRVEKKSGLEVYYSAGDSPEFSAARVLKRPLTPGENDIWLRLPAQGLGSYLRLDPIWAEGRVELDALEVLRLASRKKAGG